MFVFTHLYIIDHNELYSIYNNNILLSIYKLILYKIFQCTKKYNQAVLIRNALNVLITMKLS